MPALLAKAFARRAKRPALVRRTRSRLPALLWTGAEARVERSAMVVVAELEGSHPRGAQAAFPHDLCTVTHQAKRNGTTPLHIACLNGNVACAQLLLERGADVEHANRLGATPLGLAACRGQVAWSRPQRQERKWPHKVRVLRMNGDWVVASVVGDDVELAGREGRVRIWEVMFAGAGYVAWQEAGAAEARGQSNAIT